MKKGFSILEANTILRRLVCFSFVCATVVLMGGWYVPDGKPSIDIMTRKEVALRLAEALPQSVDSASQPTDVEPQVAIGLNSVLAAKVMALYPDGTFRPSEPMRIGEVLQAWHRTWHGQNIGQRDKKLFDSAQIDYSTLASSWQWGKEALAFLAEIDANLAENMAAFSPNDYATHGLWRLLPLPEQKQTTNALQTSAKITGYLLDALTQAPICGAVGTVDGKAFTTDIDGEFVIPESQKAGIRDVFVAVDGYRSLSLRWNPAVKSELKLFLRPFLVHLEIKTVNIAGKPIKNTAVTLEGFGTTFTDADGKALIRSLKPGYYKISAKAKGKKQTEQLVYVPETGTKYTMTLSAL